MRPAARPDGPKHDNAVVAGRGHGNDIERWEWRIDTCAEHLPEALRQLGAARQRRQVRGDRRFGATVRNAEHQGAAIGVGKRHDLFQDFVSGPVADPAMALHPGIGIARAPCRQAFLELDLHPFRHAFVDQGLNIACIDPFSRFRENSGHANFIPMDRSPRYSEKTDLKTASIARLVFSCRPAIRWRRFRLTGPATLDMTPQVSIDSGLMGLAAGRLALEPRDHIGIHSGDTGLSIFPPRMEIPGVEHGAGLADHQRRHCEIE